MLCNRLFHVLCHQITAVVSPAFPHLPFAADGPVEHFFPFVSLDTFSSRWALAFVTLFLDSWTAPLLSAWITSSCFHLPVY